MSGDREQPGGRDHGAGGAPDRSPPAEASRHARVSAAEALRALRFLLDAISLAGRGVPGEEVPGLRELGILLDTAAGALAPGGEQEGELLGALFEAIEVEIRRWEARADDDPEARAVLRAWIGLRELLFELGARPRRARRRTGEAPAGRGRRVRRVPVED